jgi:hypothetical protein
MLLKDNNLKTTIIPGHPSGSGCRVNYLNNIINTFRPEPPTAKMPPAQGYIQNLESELKISGQRVRFSSF